MAYYGLEARMPFGDRDLVSYVQGLDPALVVPQNGLEKALLRKAFENTGLLPNEVLFRRKEAFSDAVSTQTKSWYQSIQEHIETIVTDTEFNTEAPKFKWCTPYTKESYYYRKLFTKYFGEGEGKSKVIPYYWLPRWTSETTDPSARTLKLYNDGK
jgi:asparagine synthase (glutamine-hydrolysing)